MAARILKDFKVPTGANVSKKSKPAPCAKPCATTLAFFRSIDPSALYLFRRMVLQPMILVSSGFFNHFPSIVSYEIPYLQTYSIVPIAAITSIYSAFEWYFCRIHSNFIDCCEVRCCKVALKFRFTSSCVSMRSHFLVFFIFLDSGRIRGCIFETVEWRFVFGFFCYFLVRFSCR